MNKNNAGETLREYIDHIIGRFYRLTGQNVFGYFPEGHFTAAWRTNTAAEAALYLAVTQLDATARMKLAHSIPGSTMPDFNLSEHFSTLKDGEGDSLPEELVPFKGKDLLVVRVPLDIVFSEEAVELDDRENEPKATDEQIRQYVDSGAIICDFNTEDHDQLTGAAIQSMSLKLGQMQVFRP